MKIYDYPPEQVLANDCRSCKFANTDKCNYVETTNYIDCKNWVNKSLLPNIGHGRLYKV